MLFSTSQKKKRNQCISSFEHLRPSSKAASLLSLLCLRCVSHLTSVQTWRTCWGICYRWKHTAQTCLFFFSEFLFLRIRISGWRWRWISQKSFIMLCFFCFRLISQNVTGTSRTGSTTSRDTSGLQPPTGLPSTRKRYACALCAHSVGVWLHLFLCLLLNWCLRLCLGGSSLRPQVQRTRRHQQLRRLRGGGDPRLLHWEMCQGVCWVLESKSDRWRKRGVGRVKGRLVTWETWGESTVSCPITSTSYKKGRGNGIEKGKKN